MKNFKIIDGDITSAKGFQASGIHIGIKKQKKDISLVYSNVLADVAGIFTTNKVSAAPIQVTRENISDGKGQAILINSGVANACTGKKGYEDAIKTLEITSEELNISKNDVIIASTGVIGVPLPMEKMELGIKKAAKALSYDGGHDAAEAIMTTDTFPKKIAVSLEIDGKEIKIGGMAKGSGMIEPNMATMLSFITTDAKVDGKFLQKLLKHTADKTYNMITVDGDTSNNDMVCVMANGMAGNNMIDENHPEVEKFIDAFYFINEHIAKLIVKDGEGATKFIEVEVINAKSQKDSRIVAKSILNSNLVKTAFFGEDANWGRIICSIGYSDADFIVDDIEVFISGKDETIKIIENGGGTDFDYELMDEILKEKELKILVNLNAGSENAKGWGCDLSYDYVKINGSYRS